MTPHPTSRLEDILVEKATDHANRAGVPAAEMIAEYRALVDPAQDPARPRIAPHSAKLYGLLAGHGLSDDEHHRAIERKFQ